LNRLLREAADALDESKDALDWAGQRIKELEQNVLRIKELEAGTPTSQRTGLLQTAERAELQARKELAACEARLAAAERRLGEVNDSFYAQGDRLDAAERVVEAARDAVKYDGSSDVIEDMADALVAYDAAAPNSGVSE
jgi:chromosome condensin MukBEF complex kleisin-like MukF subunit